MFKRREDLLRRHIAIGRNACDAYFCPPRCMAEALSE
jgi:hypothetical protein